MDRVWQLQEAKNRLSEVIDAALRRGPQVITRRGTEVAIVMSYAEYRKLKQAQKKLTDFFRDSPLAGMRFERDRGAARGDVEL